jgi:signal transduction histidine kinase
VVETVADAYAAVAEEKRQTLSTFIESRLAVYGDRELVMQMVANVIENAIRHCPAGSTIDVTAKHTSGTKIVEVADDGPGIPVDFRAKVFNRFYRLDLSRSTPGSGLGLSLVAAVVKLHNASITLGDNSPGLRVFISLPDGGIARPQARIGPAI